MALQDSGQSLGVADKVMLERRKYKRFQVQDDAVAVLRPFVDMRGPIIDISRGGLAFRYITAKSSQDRSSKLDIMLPDLSFCLGSLPIKKICDFEVTSKLVFGNTKTRRCSVQFRNLTNEQMSQLDHFIENHSVAVKQTISYSINPH